MDLLEERRADRYRRSRRQAARRAGPGSSRGAWRPRGAWALAVVLAVGLVAGGALGWSVARAGRQPAAPAAQPAGASPACLAVLAKADESLAAAVRIKRVLADQTRVMDQLAGGGVTPAKAVAVSRQSLGKGSADAARFDAALADYLGAVGGCRAP
jgi:hypothetical protein